MKRVDIRLIAFITGITILLMAFPLAIGNIIIESFQNRFAAHPSIYASAFAFGGCEQDCGKCHSLSLDEARDVLKEIIPDIRVIEIRMAPAGGLWEVALESKGKKGIAYVDFKKENVIIGQIVKIKTKENLTRERFIELNKVDFSKIPLGDALVLGESKAIHRVVIFGDPD